MLEHEGTYNDLSTELRKELETRIAGFGKFVRYRFNIGRENPEPTKYNGKMVYPSQWTLDPVQFKITDNKEDREDKQKVKSIGVIESMERDDKGNVVYRFTRIRVFGASEGKLVFNTENQDDLNCIALLELHPKSSNGMFPNKQLVPMFNRVDETQLANDQRAERTARKKAMDIAESMSDKEVIEFANGMATEEWDSTQELLFLRNKVEELAETAPLMFNDKVGSKKMEIQATLKKAVDNRILSINPAEGTLAWVSTQQTIISLGAGFGDKNDVERFADWFLDAGNRADATYKKLKSLTDKPVAV